MEFYKSTDAGATWAVRNAGWVAGTTDGGGRMCVTPANDSRIYVCLLGVAGPIMLRSDDKGETWTVLAANLGGMSNGNGYYDLSIAASHTNADWVFAGTTGSYRSVDAGVTWTFVGDSYAGITIHTDLQDVKCVGGDIWTATDGGMSLSTDFFATQTNFSPRNQNINGFGTWGFGQGWQEDVIALSGYHNGTKVMYSGYAPGDNLRIQGGEPATGYVMHGKERVVAFSTEGVKLIPTTIAGSFTNLTNLGKYPNEDGYGSDVSEIEFHPTCYNTMYLGKDNAFWKSTDGGTTFLQLYDFGAKPRDFEMSRSNPSVLYLATTAALYRSSNGGLAWTALALPMGCSIYRLSISLSFKDENTLWITSESNANGNKVFKSTDGGTSWTSLSTATLNGLKFNQVVHQQGTNGGVYLIGDTNGKAFYRNSNHADWQDYSTSLPAHFENLRAIPFYRDGKIRVGGTRGVWEAPLFEASTPVAQPTVDKQIAYCPRDTFYFNDYSVVKYSEATWSWNFSPAPVYISSTTARNPKVVFGSTGTYSYTVTVTDGAGSDSKTVTNEIQILANDCGVDTLAGNSLNLSAAGDYAQQSKAIGGATNTLTLSCWIKPKDIQASNSGIIFTSSGGASGLNFRTNNQIGYHWQGTSDSYNWSGGPTIPANEWSHLALVITATNATIYLNGVASTKTLAHTPTTFDQVFQFGIDRSNTSRNFKGQMDEVCVYNRALSQNEIRELMNLTRNNPNAGMPGVDASLISYYQFNESASKPTYDKSKDNNLTFVGGVTKTTVSTAPVGGGSAHRMTVNTGGVKDFIGTNCQIEFPASGTYPNGELVVTALNIAPDQNPTTGSSINNKYWVIRNYGTNTFSTLSSIRFSNLGNSAIGAANNFKLYKRNSNADGATWGISVDAADVLSSANNNTLTFSTGNGITSFSQFMLTQEAVLAVELLDFKAVLNNKAVDVSWRVADEKDVLHYIVERSTDGKVFEVLKQQKTEQSLTYTVKDETPQYGTNYYRLKIVEKDGSVRYSAVKSVVLESSQMSYNVYPNPTADKLNIEFVAERTQVIDFELINVVGQIVYRYTLQSKEGKNHLFFNTNSIPAGLYSLKIRQGNKMKIEKVIIQ
jgi:Concanavalin A-like lectin/glucanases superfamily/Secretion system C-terminal sorting domain